MDLKRCKVQRGYITTKKEEECASVDRRHPNYVAEKERVTSGWVLELPMHILVDILSRLPMETVFSCKCVCKTFLNILTDRYFAELHLRKAPTVDYNLIVQSFINHSDFSIANRSDLEKPSAFPSWKYDYNYNSRPWRSLVEPRTVSESSIPFVADLKGSCNGLLFLSYYEHEDVTNFYVCNPILGEFMILPPNRIDFVAAGAIGFCPDTKLYKVICFENTRHCEIHTLGTDCWRRIENAPFPRHSDSISSSMKGSLHWITETSNVSNLICSLNLESEQLRYLSPPSHFNRDTIKKISCMNAGAVGGLFCVFYLLEEAQLEVFVMKEYGVVSSWTKEFTVNLRFGFLRQSVHIVPKMLLDNGDLLVCYNYECLVYYSFQKRMFKELMVPSMFDVVAHAPSFVSLKDIVGDKKVEVVQRNGPEWENYKCPYETGYAAVKRDPIREVGQWSDEEVLRLQQAVSGIQYSTKTSTRIAWGPVAQEVGTRTANQCKWKWQCMRKLGLYTIERLIRAVGSGL